MELTLIWFPLAKTVFAVSGLLLAYWFYRKRLHKMAIATVVLMAIIVLFAPVRYDGTESVQHSKVQQAQRMQEYLEVDEPYVHTQKPTFKERMEAEKQRSLEANTNLKKDLK